MEKLEDFLVYASFSVIFYKFHSHLYAAVIIHKRILSVTLHCLYWPYSSLLTFSEIFMHSDTLQLLGMPQNLPYHRFGIQLWGFLFGCKMIVFWTGKESVVHFNRDIYLKKKGLHVSKIYTCTTFMHIEWKSTVKLIKSSSLKSLVWN